jgi:hypothetical protein
MKSLSAFCETAWEEALKLCTKFSTSPVISIPRVKKSFTIFSTFSKRPVSEMSFIMVITLGRTSPTTQRQYTEEQLKHIGIDLLDEKGEPQQ